MGKPTIRQTQDVENSGKKQNDDDNTGDDGHQHLHGANGSVDSAERRDGDAAAKVHSW